MSHPQLRHPLAVGRLVECRALLGKGEEEKEEELI
jgi:hypothetical protein